MSYDSDNHIPFILGLSEAMDAQPGSTPGSDMAVERPEADTKVTRIRHSTLKHLICILTKHTWTNDTTTPRTQGVTVKNVDNKRNCDTVE